MTIARVESVAAIVLRGKNHVLAFARGGLMTNLGLPAGYIDPGETGKAAVRRELEEETGLVANCDPQLIYESQSKDSYCFGFLITSWTGRLITAEEVQGGDIGFPVWVELHQLLQPSCEFREYNSGWMEKLGLL